VRLAQFGSVVSAVNRPSPATARTRRSGPPHRLSKRFSSLSSSTRSAPETMDERRAHHIEPVDRSQLLGEPRQVLHRRGESSEQHVADHGLPGGRGIGLNLLDDAIAVVSPAVSISFRSSFRGWSERTDPNDEIPGSMPRIARNDDFVVNQTAFTPFDQFCADLVRLFLLRPMAASPDRYFSSRE